MDAHEQDIKKRIQQGESLTLEFKSDLKCLADRELVTAVVALANTEGGDLLLGVEDDGTVTGLHPNHARLESLPALIANRTNPSLGVRVPSGKISRLPPLRTAAMQSSTRPTPSSLLT